jgi:hypothetical protein
MSSHRSSSQRNEMRNLSGAFNKYNKSIIANKNDNEVSIHFETRNSEAVFLVARIKHCKSLLQAISAVRKQIKDSLPVTSSRAIVPTSRKMKN